MEKILDVKRDEFKDVELWESDVDENDELTPIDWDSLPKEEYISTVKFAYQHPTALLFIGMEEYSFDYDSTDWKTLFSKYTTEDWIETEEEKAFYDNLDYMMLVYRTATEENKDGLSYTTNRAVAKYFLEKSYYYKDKKAKIWEKVIKKSDVKAVLLDMGEDELIII